MSHPHPAPVIAGVLTLLAEKLEARAHRSSLLVSAALMAVAQEIRATAKELK